MQYTGFPIYDFKTGLFNEREPWISPADAFESFNNCKLDRGIIEKRKGYTYFSRLNYYCEDITDITQADPAVVTTSGNHGLTTGDFVSLNEISGMSELNGESAPITVLSATTFSLDSIDSTAYTAYTSDGVVFYAPNIDDCIGISSISKSEIAVVTTSGNHGFSDGDIIQILISANGMEEIKNAYSSITVLTPTQFQMNEIDTRVFTDYVDGGYCGLLSSSQITGIGEFINSSGQGTLLACDKYRIGVYNTTTKQIYDIALADIFTGNVNDSFIFQNWLGKIYFTNDVDRVYSWDGTTLATPTIDFTGDASNDVDTCKDIKLLGNRLILFAPTESAVKYNQRIRYSALVNPAVWDDTITAGGGYIDVATSDEFISSSYLKDKIVLRFSRSTWLMSQTGNIDLPFKVEKIDSTYLANSKNGSAAFSDKVFTMSGDGISVTNGFRVEQFDRNIQEFQNSIEESRVQQLFSHVFEKEKELWMAYPSLDDTVNSNCIVYNYNNNSYYINDIKTSVFGSFQTSFDKTWDGEDRPWNAISDRWNDFSEGGGYALVFFGDEYGSVMRLSEGYNDNGKVIDVNLKTSIFNPFRDADGQSISSQLGEIHFLLDADRLSTLTIDLYINFDETPYKTVEFSLEPINSTTDKVIKIVHAGAVGQFHRIGIRNKEANSSIKLHMIKPFLRPAGSIKQIV